MIPYYRPWQYLCLFLSLLALGTADTAVARADKPNILFIAIDDLNDWIGPLRGHPQVQTPHMDQLARRGTTFTNAHCQAPLCNASRTSLMIGLRPDTTGIYGLAPWFREVEPYRHVVSLPQALQAHGYKTYSTGKIYHGGYGRSKTDHEFQVLGPPAQVGAWPKAKLVETPSPHKLVDWGVFPHQDQDKGDYQVANWAVRQLDRKPQEPFFLSVGFFLPHVPCYATQKWFDLYPEETLQLPPILPGDRRDTPRFSWYLHWSLPEPRLDYLQQANQWNNLVRSYLACISFVDHQVGRVLDALQRNGLEENTVVVLWSDHGWHLGEKRITGKNSLWDRSTRVPLIFAGPRIARSARCGRPVELLDLYPTLLQLAGLPKNGQLEGHSLVPQLENADAPRPWPAITTHNHDNHGIRTQRWRLIRYADGSEELYDMRADPHEWHNLAGNPEYQTIKGELSQWIPSPSVQPAPGSAHRILTYNHGVATWEGKIVGSDEPIPEINGPGK
jgi:arylsulfatase A-like enzyme